MTKEGFEFVSEKIKVFAFPFLIGIITFFLIQFYNNQEKQIDLMESVKANQAQAVIGIELLKARILNNENRLDNHETRINNYEKYLIINQR